MTQSKRSIGILGGSFDPPHLGHQMLALYALATADIDELWILPCASHAFQKPLTPFENRMAMCQLAFGHLHNIRVSDLEYSLPEPNYTVNTLEVIHEQEPDAELKLILGSDLVGELNQWHQPERIKSLARLIVVDRASLYPAAKSTFVRAGDLTHLDLKVRRYIETNCLYS